MVKIAVKTVNEEELWNTQPEPPKRKINYKTVLKVALALLLAGLLAFGIWLGIKSNILANKIFVGQKDTFGQKIKNLIRGAGGSIKLQGEDLGQVNILLLGIGGENHDGPYLSDTMILVQIRPDIKTISMTSIPRDYLVQLPGGYGQRKINAAFAEGFYKNKNWNEAGEMARTVVSNISGIDIPYFAVVDFQGFIDAVNKIGGLDIMVDRTFTDYSYPNENNGYLPPQTFKEGATHMDGKKALIFARSRHAAGPEGTDFARSQRQQKVIKAFRDKAVGMNLIQDLSNLNQLAEVFANHFHTNIAPEEILRLYQLANGFSTDNIFALSLDPATGLICSDILPENGAYVLVPCYNKTKDDVKDFFKNSFTTGRVAKEKPVVWLVAASERESMYLEMTAELMNAGVTPLFVKSTEERPLKPQLFQVNPKPGTLAMFRDKWSTNEIFLTPKGFHLDPKKVDVLVVLPKTTIIPYIPPPKPVEKIDPENKDTTDTDQITPQVIPDEKIDLDKVDPTPNTPSTTPGSTPSATPDQTSLDKSPTTTQSESNNLNKKP